MTSTMNPTSLPSDDANGRPAATPDRTALGLGALYALIAANTAQIAAGLSGIEISPPENVLPLLAATIAIGVAAVPMVRAGQRSGFVLGIVFCLVSMIGMGPHKLLLDDGAVIAPMALVGFAFEVAFIVTAVRELRTRS